MARVFVATAAPPGWTLGRWSQVSPTVWEERKLQDQKTAYQFQVVSGPSSGSPTVRLKMKDQSTEVLLLESTAQIFVDGSYFGEYVGQWQMSNGAPAPVMQSQAPMQAQAPVSGGPPQAPPRGGRGAPPQQQYPPQQQFADPGSPGLPAAPFQQKAAPPGRGGAPQKAAPPQQAYAAPEPEMNMPPAVAPRPEKIGQDRDPKMVQGLLDAAKSGDVAGVQRMLQTVDADAPGRDGKTALILGAEKGNVAIVQALLDGGADPNIGKNGNTPLTAAFQKGHQEVLRVLFQATFHSMESVVGPSGTGGYMMPQASYGDDEVPESALLELREVTQRLHNMNQKQAAPEYETQEPEYIIDNGKDVDIMREEAIRDQMRTLVAARKEGPSPKGNKQMPLES